MPTFVVLSVFSKTNQPLDETSDETILTPELQSSDGCGSAWVLKPVRSVSMSKLCTKDTRYVLELSDDKEYSRLLESIRWVNSVY